MANVVPRVKDQRWKNLRFLLSPVFSSAKLKTTSRTMNKVIERFLSKVSHGGPVELAAELDLMALENSVMSGMGLSPSVVTPDFRRSLEKVLGLSWDLFAPKLMASFPSFEPLITFFINLRLKVEYLMGYPNILMLMKACELAVEARIKEGAETSKSLRETYGDEKISKTLVHISGRIDLKIQSIGMIQCKGAHQLQRQNTTSNSKTTVATLAEIVGISYGICQSILEHLNMNIFCDYFVPRHITVQQKQNKLEICNDLIKSD
ncbi:hypothetical protein LAZ67_2002789 [Cordylochernes scorpioides]|uniref:Uncharacterized protein n=1 Tax=Cordylochernes scorpioides TaxID=51811 RepID=A0ABY6K551_9ARAC|nr:hypothetical protein LAZ67_2002789 [Cordylochernes scorpioides]